MIILKQFYEFLKSILALFRPGTLKEMFRAAFYKSKNLYKNCRLDLASVNKKIRNLTGTNIDLGLYHFYKGNNEDAHLRFRLLKMCTSSINNLIYYNLGRCYFADKKFNKAKKYFMKALHVQESYPEASYYLDKIDNVSDVERVPTSIIEQKFDYMAPYYVEEFIINRQYKGYKIILYEIIDYLHNRSSESYILDIGCGSGICAHFLKMNHVGHNITGVDVSSKMLSIANNCYVHNKSVYDELLHMSSSEYFAKLDVSEKFDIVLAIDSLGCEKDLYETFCLYQRALKKGGFILCIIQLSKSHDVEFMAGLDIFCYSQDYMLDLSSRLSMESLKILKCQLYDNVDGCLCMFVKK